MCLKGPFPGLHAKLVEIPAVLHFPRLQLFVLHRLSKNPVSWLRSRFGEIPVRVVDLRLLGRLNVPMAILEYLSSLKLEHQGQRVGSPVGSLSIFDSFQMTLDF